MSGTGGPGSGVAEARRLIEAGRSEDALPLLQEAVRAAPSDAAAWCLLGVCLAQRGALAEALPALRTAATLCPEDPAILYNYALALHRAEQADAARPGLRGGLERRPGRPGARALLAQLGEPRPPEPPGPLPAPGEADLSPFLIDDPPPGTPTPAAPKPPPAWQSRARALGPAGVLLVFLLGKAKLLLPLLKFAPKLLTTGGSMLLSIVVYAQEMGWGFGVGFVLSIFAHEMGHVFAAWRLGVPVSAPIFIPGFGALILQKRCARSAWDAALIGIGGPAAGTLAGLLCLGLYAATGNPLLIYLAFTGFVINLFNLLPVFPLDGGWITGAVSPRLWLIGLVALFAMYAVGLVRNPLLLMLLLLSLPRLWHGWKTGDATSEGGVPVTPQQRLAMGLAYVGLLAALGWLSAISHVPIPRQD